MWISSNLDISQIHILKTLRTGRRGGISGFSPTHGANPPLLPKASPGGARWALSFSLGSGSSADGDALPQEATL